MCIRDRSTPTVVFHATQFNHAFADSTSSLATVPTKSLARFKGSNNSSASLFIGNESTGAKSYLQGCNETGNGSIDILLNPFGAKVGIGNVAPSQALDVTGNIAVSGTVDGVDIAALNTTVSNITTDLVSDTSPQLGGNLDVNTKNIVFGDSGSSSDDRLQFGASQDLNIFHDGTDSHIRNNEGKLIITQDDSGGDDLHLRAKVSEESIICRRDGAVELYYDNSKKFETSSSGTLFNDDIRLVNDNDRIQIGAGTDLQLYHNGTDSYIDSQLNDLLIRSNGDDLILRASDDIFIQPQSGEHGIKVIGNGQVEIYHDNSLKFTTTADGVVLNGATDISHSSADNLQVGTGSGSNGITVYSGSDSNGSLYFADGSSASAPYRGCLLYTSPSPRDS